LCALDFEGAHKIVLRRKKLFLSRRSPSGDFLDEKAGLTI
jgi:hypothetical protein